MTAPEWRSFRGLHVQTDQDALLVGEIADDFLDGNRQLPHQGGNGEVLVAGRQPGVLQQVYDFDLVATGHMGLTEPLQVRERGHRLGGLPGHVEPKGPGLFPGLFLLATGPGHQEALRRPGRARAVRRRVAPAAPSRAASRAKFSAAMVEATSSSWAAASARSIAIWASSAFRRLAIWFNRCRWALRRMASATWSRTA